jgi:hypothetical protein
VDLSADYERELKMGQFILIAQEAAATAAEAAKNLTGWDIAPWTGLGLVALILRWLLYTHLPAKDKQIDDLVTAYNVRQDQKDTAHAQALKESRVDFKESLDKVVSHCAEEMEKLTSRFVK